MKIKPSPTRRNVALDIETVSLDPAVPEGALSATTGRIACICLLIDDGNTIVESSLMNLDEEILLRQFWRAVRPSDLLIGFNLYAFDLQFIRQRSWILGVRPSRRIDLRRFYSQEFLDLMQLWSNWGATKFSSLEAVAGAMACGHKSGHGADVARWWAGADINEIVRYCQQDVRVTYRLFHKMMFKPIPAQLREQVDNSIETPHFATDDAIVSSSSWSS